MVLPTDDGEPNFLAVEVKTHVSPEKIAEAQRIEKNTVLFLQIDDVIVPRAETEGGKEIQIYMIIAMLLFY